MQGNKCAILKIPFQTDNQKGWINGYISILNFNT